MVSKGDGQEKGSLDFLTELYFKQFRHLQIDLFKPCVLRTLFYLDRQIWMKTQHSSEGSWRPHPYLLLLLPLRGAWFCNITLITFKLHDTFSKYLMSHKTELDPKFTKKGLAVALHVAFSRTEDWVLGAHEPTSSRLTSQQIKLESLLCARNLSYFEKSCFIKTNKNKSREEFLNCEQLKTHKPETFCYG